MNILNILYYFNLRIDPEFLNSDDRIEFDKLLNNEYRNHRRNRLESIIWMYLKLWPATMLFLLSINLWFNGSFSFNITNIFWIILFSLVPLADASFDSRANFIAWIRFIQIRDESFLDKLFQNNLNILFNYDWDRSITDSIIRKIDEFVKSYKTNSGND